MLVDSPRLTPQDRQAWERLARYDRQLAEQLPLDRMAEQARMVVEDFAAAGPCYASTSWGKDSTVLSHLVATGSVRLPLVWVRVGRYDNPDCVPVRDAFLTAYGHLVDYREYHTDASGPRWWEDGTPPKPGRTFAGGFALAEKAHGRRHISGVRAEESRVRRIAQARWGDAGPHAARPIGSWTAVDVFAYLTKHGLPIHPAYAMSHGGRLDRRWLRVASIGGIRGADRGRAEWEAHYYPDIVETPVSTDRDEHRKADIP